MIVMVISLFSGRAWGIEFSFNSPGNVEENEEFEISVIADTGGNIYDVKIFVHDGNPSQRSSIVSEIYSDGEWKNPWFYLQDVFPDQTDFMIRVTEFNGEAEICTQLRKADQSAYNRVCNNIVVEQANGDVNEENNQNITLPENNLRDDEQSQNFEEENVNDEPNGGREFENSDTDWQRANTFTEIKTGREKIILNSPSKSENESNKKVFVSKQENLRLGVIYAFLFLTVLIIILLAWRKL